MKEEKNMSPANIFAIAGFALLFLIAIWSGYQVVKYAPRIFGSNSSEASIRLSINKKEWDLHEENVLTWKYKNLDENGTVSFIYQCGDGIKFELYNPAVKSFVPLDCNTPFNMPADFKDLKIKAVSANKDSVEAKIAIVYTNNKGEKIKDIQTLKINKAQATQNIQIDQSVVEDDKEGTTLARNQANQSNADLQVARNTVDTQSAQRENVNSTLSTQTQNKNRCVSKEYGTPDLKLKYLSVGTIRNGRFITKKSFASWETIVIKFDVTNTGTKKTTYWRFSANLPKTNDSYFKSSAQPSIYPCNGRVYTIKVINPAKGSHRIRVSLDPDNAIREINEYNNSADVYVSVY